MTMLTAIKNNANLRDLLCLNRISQTPRTMTELSRALGFTTAAMTGLADKLCRNKWAERRDATDRRVKLLAITPKGEELLASVMMNPNH